MSTALSAAMSIRNSETLIFLPSSALCTPLYCSTFALASLGCCCKRTVCSRRRFLLFSVGIFQSRQICRRAIGFFLLILRAVLFSLWAFKPANARAVRGTIPRTCKHPQKKISIIYRSLVECGCLHLLCFFWHSRSCLLQAAQGKK